MTTIHQTLSAEATIQKINAFEFSLILVAEGGTGFTSSNSYDLIFTNDADGSIACILPPFSSIKLESETQRKLFKVSVDASFITDWLGTANIDFTRERNIRSAFISQVLASLSGEISKNIIIEKRYSVSLAMALINELYCQFRTSGRKYFSPKGKLSAQQMKNVIDLVRASLHTEVHLSTMASEVHLSDFHFSRLFKNTFGISPYQYVLQTKVEYAKTLLRSYPRSLSQIAHSLNFTDQSHFTNVFKKMTGICPSDFVTNDVKSVA